MKRNRFPACWNEARVRRVLDHYERQTEDEAATQDGAAFRLRGQTVMVVPKRLAPEITRLIGGDRHARAGLIVAAAGQTAPAAECRSR